MLILALTIVLLADTATGASDLGGTLLGVASIVTAFGAIFLGIYSQRRRTATPADDDQGARGSTDALVETITDLYARLAACEGQRDELRRERDRAVSNEQLKDMHIGSLEGQLAEVKAELRRERGQQP